MEALFSVERLSLVLGELSCFDGIGTDYSLKVVGFLVHRLDDIFYI